MEFKRKRIKGRHYKEWHDTLKQYRITWQDQCCEVSIEPCFHACVRCTTGWGFAGRMGRYRTLNAAKKACETNRKLWDRFLAVEGRDKVTQIRNIKYRSFIGKGASAHSFMCDLPLWVEKLASPRHLEILG